MKENHLNKRKDIYYNEKMYADIILAAENNDTEGIEAAVNSGEDVNIQEHNSGITALHAACANGCLNAVNKLLEYEEINVHITDAFGRSAIDLAISLHHQKIIEVLATYLSGPLHLGYPDLGSP